MFVCVRICALCNNSIAAHITAAVASCGCLRCACVSVYICVCVHDALTVKVRLILKQLNATTHITTAVAACVFLHICLRAYVYVHYALTVKVRLILKQLNATAHITTAVAACVRFQANIRTRS